MEIHKQCYKLYQDKCHQYRIFIVENYKIMMEILLQCYLHNVVLYLQNIGNIILILKIIKDILFVIIYLEIIKLFQNYGMMNNIQIQRDILNGQVLWAVHYKDKYQKMKIIIIQLLQIILNKLFLTYQHKKELKTFLKDGIMIQLYKIRIKIQLH